MGRIAFVFVLACLYGCKEVSFKEPQPKGKKNLKAVPKNMWGNYILPGEQDLVKDTLFVTAYGYRVGHSGDKDVFLLSDSIVLRSYKGFYFLNVNQNPEWSLHVLKKEKNGDLVYMSLGRENLEFSDYLQALSSEIKIDSFQLEKGTLYQINPSPKELVSLIEKQYFKKIVLTKIP